MAVVILLLLVPRKYLLVSNCNIKESYLFILENLLNLGLMYIVNIQAHMLIIYLL